MSYPSFHTYLKTLRELLKRKSQWLLEESTLLGELCLVYGQLMGLSERDKRTLYLAAYYKNLGAVYLNDRLLEQSFDNDGQSLTQLKPWFDESVALAKAAGLRDVAIILEQYYQRAIPEHQLARIFQVLNAWVACRQQKSWRPSMSDKEALLILKQRAQMAWADPQIVSHFVEHCHLTLGRATSTPTLAPNLL